MSNDIWSDLIPRLKRDLESRVRGDSLRRDDDAWITAASMIRRYGLVIPYTHSGLTQDDANDIVQDVLIKLQTPGTLERLEVSGSPTGYIAVMVRNGATNLIRDRRRKSAFEEPLPENIAFVFEESDSETGDPKRSVRLREALTHLSPDERTLLRLRFWRGLSIRQISEKTGISYSATAVRLFRILQRLRTRLGAKM